MRFPLRESSATAIDEKRAERLLERALFAGITYFDTAYPYHGKTSEEFVGRVLSKHPRDSFALATKLPVFNIKSREEGEEIFSSQLVKLRTPYFDFYLLHAMNAGRFETVKDLGLYDMLREKKEKGIIRSLGFSFHDSPDVLERILDQWPFDFVQIQLNYLDWELQNAERQYQVITERGLPVVVMEPVRGGALSKLPKEAEGLLRSMHPEWSPAAWALRWVASKPGVMVVLSGMSAEDQLEDNLSTFSSLAPWRDDEEEALGKAREILLSAGTVKCTGCKYCLPCTKGIEIPSLFSMYNDYLIQGDREKLCSGYRKTPVPASSCIDCLKCVRVCPQKLEVNKLIKQVEKTAKAYGA